MGSELKFQEVVSELGYWRVSILKNGKEAGCILEPDNWVGKTADELRQIADELDRRNGTTRQADTTLERVKEHCEGALEGASRIAERDGNEMYRGQAVAFKEILDAIETELLEGQSKETG